MEGCPRPAPCRLVDAKKGTENVAHVRSKRALMKWKNVMCLSLILHAYQLHRIVQYIQKSPYLYLPPTFVQQSDRLFLIQYWKLVSKCWISSSIDKCHIDYSGQMHFYISHRNLRHYNIGNKWKQGMRMRGIWNERTGVLTRCQTPNISYQYVSSSLTSKEKEEHAMKWYECKIQKSGQPILNWYCYS